MYKTGSSVLFWNSVENLPWPDKMPENKKMKVHSIDFVWSTKGTLTKLQSKVSERYITSKWVHAFEILSLSHTHRVLLTGPHSCGLLEVRSPSPPPQLPGNIYARQRSRTTTAAKPPGSAATRLPKSQCAGWFVALHHTSSWCVSWLLPLSLLSAFQGRLKLTELCVESSFIRVMRVIVLIIHIFFLHSAKSAQGESNTFENVLKIFR